MFSSHHVFQTPHKHGNTQNTGVLSLATKESEFYFSYLLELIILCKPSHAHVFSTRLVTIYFFTLQVSWELPAAIPQLKHGLPTILASFSKPSVLHSPLHFPEILSPPFHSHIHQLQYLLGGTTVSYSPSLSNLSSSPSYNHTFRVSSTRKALPTNPCSFPFIYLKKKNSLLFLFRHYLWVVLTLGSYMDPQSGGGSRAVFQ